MFAKDGLVKELPNPKLLRAEVDAMKQRRATQAKKQLDQDLTLYTVQKGDNLIKVAEIFRQNINHIRQLNQFPTSDISLTAGMKIKIIDKANRELYPDIDRYLIKPDNIETETTKKKLIKEYKDIITSN